MIGMPRFLRPVALGVCAALAATGAFGQPARPETARVCTRPDILSFALDRLRQQDAHIALVANSAVEVATMRSDVVLCALSVQIDYYDAFLYREHPARLTEPRYFEARTLGSGFVLDFTGR
jgi:hypothetical protein